MKNGTCTRCNSSQVYRHAGHGLQMEKITLKPSLVFGTTSAPDRYACTSCGHVEFYISSAKDLQTIRDSWEKVTS
jgi:ribosomal protein S27AE